jgi:hypothetical protein
MIMKIPEIFEYRGEDKKIKSEMMEILGYIMIIIQ